MKTILAVMFLGVLTLAFADFPIQFELCQNLNAMRNFNSSRFLTGTWYVTHAKNGPNYTVCQEYKTENKHGTQKLIIEGSYRNGTKLIGHHPVHCQKQSEQNGILTFYCKQSRPAGGGNKRENLLFQLIVTVLSTDYSDFALMYRCAKAARGNSRDNVLVLHRDHSKTDDKVNVEQTLKSKRWSLDTFMSRKGVNCQKPQQKRTL